MAEQGVIKVTIRDFLELCTMVGEPIALYDLNTNEMIIGEVGEPNIFRTISSEILNAELMSWDYVEHDGEQVVCLNYES